MDTNKVVNTNKTDKTGQELVIETTKTFSLKELLMAIMAIMLISASLRAPLTVVGPQLGAIQAETQLSAMTLGVLTALPIIVFGLFSPLAPGLAELFGMEHVLVFSMLVLTGGIMLRSMNGVVALFLGTVILGVAIAIVNVLLPSLVKRDYSHQLGLMTGVYSTSMNLFAALASGISVPLAHIGLGWRGALGCWALLSFIAFIIWLPKIRGKQAKTGASTVQRVSFTALLRSGLAWQVTFYMGLQSIGFYTMAAWFPEILHSRGFSLSFAGWLIAVIQFISMFSMFFVPIWAARRASQHSFVVVISILMFFGYLSLFSQHMGFLMMAVFLLGLGQGASFALAVSFFGLRSRNAQQAAMLSGMAQSIGYLISAIGPISFGVLYDWTGSWTWPLICLTATSILLLVVGLGASRDRYVSVE